MVLLWWCAVVVVLCVVVCCCVLLCGCGCSCCFGQCIMCVSVHITNACKSLGLIYVGQCLCTDPYLLPVIMPTAIHVRLVETSNF